MKRADLADVLVFVGLALLAGGLAAYDWRVALVACGGLLFAVGFAAAWQRRGRDGR